MLTQVEKVLPLSASAWEKVEVAYNRAAAGQPHRDVVVIRLKLTTLKNVRKLTGDPTCPPTVTHVKCIQRLIDSAALVALLDDDASDNCADAVAVSVWNDNEQLDEDELEAGQESDADHVSTVASQRETSIATLSTDKDVIPPPNAAKKPNRVGLAPLQLAQLGKCIARTQSGNGRQSQTSSYTAQKRQSIDRLLHQEQQNGQVDMATLFAMMDEREAARNTVRGA